MAQPACSNVTVNILARAHLLEGRLENISQCALYGFCGLIWYKANGDVSFRCTRDDGRVSWYRALNVMNGERGLSPSGL